VRRSNPELFLGKPLHCHAEALGLDPSGLKHDNHVGRLVAEQIGCGATGFHPRICIGDLVGPG
jgi:hypothetical protein